MSTGFNYDKIMGRMHHKYAVPIIAAKRAQEIKNDKEMKEPNKHHANKNYVEEAFVDIQNGKTIIRDVDKIDEIKTKLK